MCSPAEAYFRILDWIDKHRITFTMLIGFAVAAYVRDIFQENNALLLNIVEKQNIVQLETAKALQELSLRHAETNTRLAALEAEHRRGQPASHSKK